MNFWKCSLAAAAIALSACPALADAPLRQIDCGARGGGIPAREFRTTSGILEFVLDAGPGDTAVVGMLKWLEGSGEMRPIAVSIIYDPAASDGWAPMRISVGLLGGFRAPDGSVPAEIRLTIDGNLAGRWPYAESVGRTSSGAMSFMSIASPRDNSRPDLIEALRKGRHFSASIVAADGSELARSEGEPPNSTDWRRYKTVELPALMEQAFATIPACAGPPPVAPAPPPIPSH